MKVCFKEKQKQKKQHHLELCGFYLSVCKSVFIYPTWNMCNILDTRVVRILLPVVNERTDDNNHNVQDVEAKVP